ncbi:ROK family protein [Humibacter sp.]|uniref:ROK family protein n=1 Tax=Humibacter sp. TaxID=1940291 RepID=UPI003F8041F1
MRVGLDIGGTKIDAVVLDDDLDVIAKVRIPTGLGPGGVLASAERAVREVVAVSDASLRDVSSVGIGIPGMVDAVTGEVHHAVNLELEHLALADELALRIGAPVRVENDVKAAALGAYHVLGLSGSAALLNLGTGLAAGIVVDGCLWRGAEGGAGEIGHIPVVPGGVLCSCGQRGCLETIASGSAVARLWPSKTEPPAVALFDAAHAGDSRAQEVRRELLEGVASAVRVLVLTVDVGTVVIAGGLSNLGDRLRAPVCEVLRDWSAGSAFLASLGLASRVRMLPPELSAAAVGAALVGRAGPVGGAALVEQTGTGTRELLEGHPWKS